MNVFGRAVLPREITFGALLAALVLTVSAALAPTARAELVIWDNYSGTPDSIASANIDGSGGGLLNLGGNAVENPEGMAYDTVTNRLFVASEAGSANGGILAINLDGSGAAPFTAPGAPIAEPEGIAVDPVSRIIYWENTEGAGSIAWANLDGSGGGALNTVGATGTGPCCRIAIDPVGGRVYWVNGNGVNPNTISYANLNNSGGGDLNLVGTTIEPGGEGLAVDPAAGRLYFLGGTNQIGFANLNGSGGGDVPTVGAPLNGPYGIALDPSLGRLYAANYSNAAVATNAIGIVNLAGGGGGITPASAPVAGPQDPVILKSPSGAGLPAVTSAPKTPAVLSCSTGSWGADYAGSFVYQAPRSYAYQWTLNGAPLAGATASTYTGTSPGSYACVVTATNQAGSASQTSVATEIEAAKLKLTVKTKKVKVKAGKLATFKVQVQNQGDLKSKNARLCVTVPKKAKADLKAKCASLGKLAALAKKTAKLKVRVGPEATGTYKLKIVPKGVPGKSAKATLKVIG